MSWKKKHPEKNQWDKYGTFPVLALTSESILFAASASTLHLRFYTVRFRFT